MRDPSLSSLRYLCLLLFVFGYANTMIFYFQNESIPLVFTFQKNLWFVPTILDGIINDVIERLGDVQKVYVTGEFAKGLDSQIIDLVFIGDVNKQYLIQLIEKTEKLIRRKIRYIVYSYDEEPKIDWSKLDFKPLLLWSDEA